MATPNSEERLGDDQELMVRRVTTSDDGIVCVVGEAGAGKTTAIRAAARVFAASGVPVLGAAPSGHAAEKLADETGLTTMTLHRLRETTAREGGLPLGCVLFVDEAGMAETRVLEPVLEAVAHASGKTVLVGDPAQLPAVGAGGLFEAILERLGAVHLTENRRQTDAIERRALSAIRAGWGRDYIDWADSNERLVHASDPIAARARLVGDWWAAARDDLAGTVMIAFERRDVAELNAVARGLLRAAGRLGPEQLSANGVEFAIGDRVVCLRNNDFLAIRNGTRGSVEAVDHVRRKLAVRTDRGALVELNARYLDGGHVRHAYALTGHAGQGATVRRAFVLGHDRGRLQEWGYVALSRAREATRMYVAEAFEPAERVEPGAVAARSTLERLTASLENSDRETLASLSADRHTDTVARAVWQQQPATTPTAREHLRAI